MGVRSDENNTASVNRFEVFERFKVNIEDIEKQESKCVESPAFQLNALNWIIRACKKAEKDEGEADEKDRFQIFLVANFGDSDADKICEAKVHFTLLAKEGVQAREGSFDYTKFTKNYVHGFKTFVKWDQEFKDNHVQNNIATIEATITTKSPIVQSNSQFEQLSTKVNVMVKDVSKLGQKYSNEFVFRNIRWKVLSLQKNNFFASYVYANPDDMGLNQSWNVTANFQVISPVKDQTVKRKFVNVIFNWRNSNWGFQDLVKWSDFMDEKKQFVISNSALLEVELIVVGPILS